MSKTDTPRPYKQALDRLRGAGLRPTRQRLALAKMLLEGPDRSLWQKPDEIMDALNIADGSRVADVGAGAGWFTVRLARRAGRDEQMPMGADTVPVASAVRLDLGWGGIPRLARFCSVFCL